MVRPPDLGFSVSWAEKGPYRKDSLLQFLDKVLPLWIADREARRDYEILLMDVAASHAHEEIADFAWASGFVVLYHYGCTTGVTQVNGTDLHGALKALYVELEHMSFNEQQLIEPGSVSRRPQDVLNDAAGTCRGLDHRQGVEGHLRNGLSNKLDGAQDSRSTARQ